MTGVQTCALPIYPNTSIHPHNRKRIERALRYYEKTGKPFSGKKKSQTLWHDATVIGLTLDREILYQRINERVDYMVKQGLLEEAQRIYLQPLRTKAVLTPIGYKELFPYFEGSESLEDALAKIKQHSRNYAKRQYTWFLHQMNVTWISVNLEHFEDTIKEACHQIGI